MTAIRFAVFLFLALNLELSTAEVRWCANGSRMLENSFTENATQYNDELYACMECTRTARLVLRDEMSRYECCDGHTAPVGACALEDLLHSCNVRTKCDGTRQCYDGWDEKGCYGCSNDTFGCDGSSDEGPRCLPMNKLCDSVKDCRDGRDETLCPYYGGWCNGYLCGGKHPKCIQHSKICNGEKDCLDGSDESNCQYCPNQFRCRVYLKEEIGATSAECIGRFRVCDGVRDCINGADELKCHRWQEWEDWSECGTVTESCTRIRRRSCVNYEAVVVDSAECYGTESNGLNENQVDICPACLSNATTVPTGSTAFVPGVTDESYSGASPTTPIRKAGAVNFSFDSGAQIAVAVAVSLVILAIIIGVLIAACKLKHTGFWRPPCKLPQPSRSILPGISIAGRRRIKPMKKVSNPYPIKGSKKSEVPEVTDETLPLPPPPKESSAMTLHSVSFEEPGHRAESPSMEAKTKGKDKKDVPPDSSRSGHIGRTVV